MKLINFILVYSERFFFHSSTNSGAIMCEFCSHAFLNVSCS